MGEDLPVLSVQQDALVASHVPAWHYHSVFVGVVADVAELLFIELFLCNLTC